MRKEIMKGEKTSTDLLNVRRWMAIAAVPLFALICSFALKSEAYASRAVNVSVDGADTDGCAVTATNNRETSTTTLVATPGDRITITATPADRFQGWIVLSGNVDLATTAETTFTMPDGDVGICAVFTAAPQQPTSPNPSNDDSSGDPPKNDDPDPNDTMAGFLDDVTHRVKDLLILPEENHQFPHYLYDNGFTIYAGTWESFDKNTAEILDELIARGIKVNIEYTHNNINKTVTIPANFKFKLKDMCKNRYVGFEYIYATVANGKRPDEETHTTVMGATAGMAALSRGNDFVGSATEGLAMNTNTTPDGASTFAQMGGGSMRQETG